VFDRFVILCLYIDTGCQRPRPGSMVPLNHLEGKQENQFAVSW